MTPKFICVSEEFYLRANKAFHVEDLFALPLPIVDCCLCPPLRHRRWCRCLCCQRRRPSPSLTSLPLSTSSPSSLLPSSLSPSPPLPPSFPPPYRVVVVRRQRWRAMQGQVVFSLLVQQSSILDNIALNRLPKALFPRLEMQHDE